MKIKGLLAISCFLFVVLSISGCGNLPQGRYGQEAVKIAVMPAYSTASMSTKYLPLLNRLSKETGYDVQYISAENLSGFGAAIENSGAQFVICDALALLTLMKTKNAMPLVAFQSSEGTTSTRGLVVTTVSRYASGVVGISKLKAHDVCCVSKQSAEGYISQAKLLSDSGIDPERELRVITLGQFDKIIPSIQKGNFAAGFIPKSLWNDSMAKCLRVLGEGRDVPEWCLVSLQGGRTELDDKLKDALLSLNPAKEEDKKLLLLLGVARFSVPNVDDFNEFSRSADQLNIPY